MLSSIKNWLKLSLIYPIKVVSSLERASSFVLTAIIIFLMFFVGAEVVSRYFFKPIPGHYDLTELLLPLLVFLGLTYAQSFHGHIRVEFFINMLKGRVYHFVESLGLALSLCLFLLLAIYTFGNALTAYQVGSVTEGHYFPTWCTRLFISIGSAVMCFRLIIQLTQNLIQLAKGIERKDLNRARMGG